MSEYLSIQNKMACFLNSWGISLYRLVTSNVASGVLGSIFSGMKFIKNKVVFNIAFLNFI